MRIVLPEALHARPANLLVRLAGQHAAVVEVRKGTCRADARKILEVLSLAAAKGDEIDIVATGDDAERAVAAIAELVARNFDGDLVPETGSAAVEGIAIGRAVVIAKREASGGATGAIDDEIARLREAERRAVRGLEALCDALPAEERALFEPERAILEGMVDATIARVRAGEVLEDALGALASGATTDLVIDAQARLLEALADGGAVDWSACVDRGEESIVVAEVLTPSLVAQLPPCVRGIVAAEDDPDARGGVTRTSHAAILARGRELPLAFVPQHVALAIAEGDHVVVDTTVAPARVWVAPSASLLDDARARREAHATQRAAIATDAARVQSAHGVDLLVNVGSLHDRVPEGAAGVGLLRTELVFAQRTSAPSEADQVAALLAVSRAARGAPVTARLFDAGGDKPLSWLAGDADARGIALLLASGANVAVLDAQCAAIARAATRADVRALIPMVRSRADVDAVRARLGAGVRVGAMIETPDAAKDANAIAAAADFVSIGTNDLAAAVLGGRGDATRALDPRVLLHVTAIVAAAHAHGKRVTVCGEVAADPRGARILVGIGADGLSVSPARLADAVLALRDVTKGDCAAAARAALSPSS